MELCVERLAQDSQSEEIAAAKSSKKRYNIALQNKLSSIKTLELLILEHFDKF